MISWEVTLPAVTDTVESAPVKDQVINHQIPAIEAIRSTVAISILRNDSFSFSAFIKISFPNFRDDDTANCAVP